MRSKSRRNVRAKRPVQGDHTPIDPGDTARQIALFETSIGWQHGLLAILVALIVASLGLLVRPFLRLASRLRS